MKTASKLHKQKQGLMHELLTRQLRLDMVDSSLEIA